MALPAGVVTRTITIRVPMDLLGQPAKTFSGAIKPDRTLVWASTGEAIWPVAAKLPAPVDGVITTVVPVVDQPGIVDGNGAPVTGWTMRVSATAAWAGTTRDMAKVFQVVTADVSPVEVTLLPDAWTDPPVGEPDPYVVSIAGHTGTVTGEQIANDPALIAKLADFLAVEGVDGGAP